jgi:hypothetical protein
MPKIPANRLNRTVSIMVSTSTYPHVTLTVSVAIVFIFLQVQSGSIGRNRDGRKLGEEVIWSYTCMPVVAGL